MEAIELCFLKPPSPKCQKKLNILTFFLGLFECLLFAGIIFGWFSLRPILEAEHYFGAGREVQANNSALDENNKAPLCNEENSASSHSDNMFTLVFTIASSTLNYSSLFTGYLLDKFGTIISKAIASVLFTSGVFLMALSSEERSWIVFVSISFLIPIGGYWHFISNFQIGNLFGKWQGTIVSIFSGAFDSSSFVFLVFSELYAFGLPIQTVFLVYGFASFYLLMNAIFLLPTSFIPFPLPKNWTRRYRADTLKDIKTIDEEGQQLKETSEGVVANGAKRDSIKDTPIKETSSETSDNKVDSGKDYSEKDVNEVSATKNEDETDLNGNQKNEKPVVNLDGNMDLVIRQEPKNQNEPSFWKDCVFTLRFLFHVLFVSVNQLKIYIFLSVVPRFIDTFDLEEEDSTTMRRTLGIVQLSAIFWSPIVGLIVDRNKQGGVRRFDENLYDFVMPLGVTCIVGVFCSANLLIPLANFQYLTFFLQVILRAFNYGLAFSFIACTFPPQHIGKLIGLLMAVAATFSLLQYPMIQSVNFCEPDYTILHIVLLVLSVFPFCHPAYVWFEAKKLAQLATSKHQDQVLPDAQANGTSV